MKANTEELALQDAADQGLDLERGTTKVNAILIQGAPNAYVTTAAAPAPHARKQRADAGKPRPRPVAPGLIVLRLELDEAGAKALLARFIEENQYKLAVPIMAALERHAAAQAKAQK